MAELAIDEVEGDSLPAEFEFAFQQLTATEKAAIVMFLLEEAGAAAVMQTLSPTQVTSVSRAMISVSDVPQPIVVAVVDEFLNNLQGLTDLGLEGPGYVKKVLLASGRRIKGGHCARES